MIGVSNHLLSVVFSVHYGHYHSQKVIGSLGTIDTQITFQANIEMEHLPCVDVFSTEKTGDFHCYVSLLEGSCIYTNLEAMMRRLFECVLFESWICSR